MAWMKRYGFFAPDAQKIILESGVSLLQFFGYCALNFFVHVHGFMTGYCGIVECKLLINVPFVLMPFKFPSSTQVIFQGFVKVCLLLCINWEYYIIVQKAHHNSIMYDFMPLGFSIFVDYSSGCPQTPFNQFQEVLLCMCIILSHKIGGYFVSCGSTPHQVAWDALTQRFHGP